MAHRFVKTIKTKYMFQVHVFKVKLSLFSFKNPKLLILETRGHENGYFSKQAL